MSSDAINRREFTKATAAIAAAFGLSHFELPPLLPEVHAAGREVNWGMIGTGTRGHELLRQLAKIQTGRCAALCDIYPTNLKKAAETIGNNPATFDDYRRMLDRKDIEAVLVVTPLDTHAKITLDALSAGKHVFCEKTMVFKEAEVQALRDAVTAHPKQVFQVGLQRRYSDIYRMALQMMRRGALGKITHVRANWHRNSDWRRPVSDPKLERLINWRMYKEHSGGLMAELGSHQLDVANWIFNAEPRSVIGFGGIDYWKDGRETYDNAQCLFEYASGQKVTWTSLLNNAHYDFGEQIMGDGGTVEITLSGSTGGAGVFFVEPKVKATAKGNVAAKEQWWAGATVTASSIQTPFPIFPDEIKPEQPFMERETGFAKRWLARKGWYEVREPKNPVGSQLEHFFMCITDGLKPISDINVGAGDAECVIYANQAMEEDRRVYWPKYRTSV